MQNNENKSTADNAYAIRRNLRDVYQAFSVAGNYQFIQKNSIQWMDTGIKVPDFNPIFDIENDRASDLNGVYEAISHYRDQNLPILIFALRR